MASETSGIPKMIVEYEWILENVEKEPKTIASKMILFRGEKVFRVSLKNRVQSPVLFFMAIDLKKIAMKVEGAKYGIQNSDNSPATMWQMKEQLVDGDDGSLQIFTIDLSSQVIGNCTFVFRICIEGILPCYSYRLSDRLAKDQLWAASFKNPNLADVEFVVKDKKFPAHKSILAARSAMFAAEFTSEQPAGDGPFQIRMDNVDPSTVEQFLYFIYTGETMGTLANEELLMLATNYGQLTLCKLCHFALQKINLVQTMSVRKRLHKEGDILSSIIRPEKETEIFFDRTTTTFRCGCGLSLNLAENPPSKSVLQYQNEYIFFAYFNDEDKKWWTGDQHILNQPVINCSYAKHCSFGMKLEDIYFSGIRTGGQWFKMESTNLKENYELLHFATKPPLYVHRDGDKVYFDIKIVSTIANYYGEMMDDAWMNDFWLAATNRKFADVEIFVGTVKLMEAHRVILSARSPVMSALLGMPGITGKPTVNIGAQFNVDIVKNFLKFLYTGFLEISANNKQLRELATIYEVETLKNLCQLANRAPPDVEKLSNFLLEL